jgi:hypothetical protein
MPQAKTQPKASARKAPTRRPPTKAKGEDRRTAPLDRTEKLAEETIKSLESAQRSAIEAVRKFTETVDQARPLGGDGPSRQQEVIDSALEMAERLVRTQYEFLDKVIHSAGESMRQPEKS